MSFSFIFLFLLFSSFLFPFSSFLHSLFFAYISSSLLFYFLFFYFLLFLILSSFFFVKFLIIRFFFHLHIQHYRYVTSQTKYFHCSVFFSFLFFFSRLYIRRPLYFFSSPLFCHFQHGHQSLEPLSISLSPPLSFWRIRSLNPRHVYSIMRTPDSKYK